MNELLSKLPNMNSLLTHPLLSEITSDRVKHIAADILSAQRAGILSGTITTLISPDDCAQLIYSKITDEHHNLRRVINATGVVLHTNLGRAPLGEALIAQALESCSGYCNLEYDLETGKRGSRYTHVEKLICEITGAQAAMVANNNAAAMVLILGSLAKGKKVAISRGELVEIGGSFRVPDVIVQSGAELVEIGSTNKTKLSDYTDAVEHKDAQVLLKVHTSNYEVIGFTQTVSVSELADYGKSVGLPVVYDLGAGFLLETERFGFTAGETAMSGLNSGADIICFSGDKLLGSAQAGIIAGRADLIAAMKKHPLTRALRPDKLTLAVLESALQLYRYPEDAVKNIPTLSMLFAQSDTLQKQAAGLSDKIQTALPDWKIGYCEIVDETGGGSLPNVSLPGWAVSLQPHNISVNELEQKLRLSKTSIIIRIQDDTALISVRTLMPGDDDRIVEMLGAVYDR
ncbi:MAG: L-seryl-tRNA(Sec) selenium transferase [Oscillospiraceae bacterium]|nr:L-seryl-tRNA(Sec) selenium transferase [Oscillospiraceae bacterium]